MRTKAFDPDEALVAALTLFWERGFESTNLLELLEQMEIGRASFYNTFASKRDVFLKSLDLYFHNVGSHLATLIVDCKDSDSAVAALIDGVLGVARSERPNTSGWRGCLIGNTALELGAHDEEIASRLRVGVQVLRAQFKRALCLPTAAGCKRSDVEIDRLALHLVAGVQGLLVLAKSGLAEEDVNMARAALIAAIDPVGHLRPSRRPDRYRSLNEST